ncbi:MAG: major capsid protein [Prevotella histicola]|uniref:major capsid protein n=1 Tax=Prevotella histicola TaxID=470565 RepID=UPI001CB3098D|nr:major capsid protein [Prevotella histicola]MBF1393887.1 major capsid protein [Prevotella histicola]
MAMNAPLFDIDLPGLQASVNNFQPGSGFSWSTLFPLKYTRKFDIKGIEGDDGIPVAADRVAFNTSAPKKTRKTVGKWSGKLSKYAVSREKDEVEINDYNDASTLAASADANPQEKLELVKIVYDDVAFCRKAMDAKVELDAMGIGCSGIQRFKAKVEGDMATEDVINFNVPKENFVGVAVGDKKDSKGVVKVQHVKWTDYEHADGLEDLIRAQDMIRRKGLPVPRYAFMERAKFADLCAQQATARRLFPQVKDLTVVSAEQINLASVNAYMQRAENNYPTIIILDTYVTVEHKDGNKETVKPWNENVVTLAPSLQLGWTYYKPVPLVQNVSALQVYGPYYKVTRYSDVNPMLETTMAEAYVQPALINRQSLVFLNTDNRDWADGESA